MLSHLFMMADFIGPVGIALVMVAVFVVLMMMIANRYMKVGPNEALIVSGMLCGPSGYKVIKGGGVFVWPFIQKTQTLSLELMTLEVHLPEVYTATGVPIIVDGVAQIKVRGQEESIRTAAEQFLSKSIAQVNNVALETVAGHLRGIVGTLTV